MSNGNWNPTQETVRPGLYNRFRDAAGARVKAGPNGIVGLPVKADWGPIGVLIDITDESQVDSIFGLGGTGTTEHLIKRALYAGKRYKPNKVVAYRMASSSAAPATATITTTVKFTARYPGNRGNSFMYAVSANILDNTKKDVKFYEGAALFAIYTVAPSDIEGLVNAINEDGTLITAEKLGIAVLADTASKSFSGGNSGTDVTATEYLAALDAYEPILINTLAMDGIMDSAIQTTVKNWAKRVREAGKEVIYCMGGSTVDDKTPSVGNARSIGCNHKAIVNVIVGTKNATRSFNSAETACQIAGLIAGAPINTSVTYKELEDVDDVTVALTDEQIKAALKSGSFVLARDYDPETYAVTVKVEQGINTLTTYSEGESPKFSKIRVVRTLDAIDYDTGRWTAKNIIGSIDNNDDGRATLISGIKLYLETLANSGAINKDFNSALDDAFISEGDTVYLNTKALHVDSIEKIFNTIEV